MDITSLAILVALVFKLVITGLCAGCIAVLIYHTIDNIRTIERATEYQQAYVTVCMFGCIICTLLWVIAVNTI